jgi:SAM-dependent methyltransferase
MLAPVAELPLKACYRRQMHMHAHHGLALPRDGWVPTPSYLLRRDRVLRHLRHLEPGLALEVGCGPGALLVDLAAKGYRCVALETSPRALELAAKVFADDSRVEVRSGAGADWDGRFDLVLAFEVLEHIEDDQAALSDWARWLKPGGRLVLSVPAHARRWNPTDEWAGPSRRYSSRDLRRVAAVAGLKVEVIESYGFPLTPLLETLRARTYQRGARASRTDQTAGSGVERRQEARLYPLLASRPGSAVMRALCVAQRAFLQTEWSNGFLMVSGKP